MGAANAGSKMKAAVVAEFGKPLEIREVGKPSAEPGKIVVKVEASGVCHTDLHAAEGDWPAKPNPPFIPGHEGVGFVAEVGAGVKHVKEGDRVEIYRPLIADPKEVRRKREAEGKRMKKGGGDLEADDSASDQ